jgi:hypothetical protein
MCVDLDKRNKEERDTITVINSGHKKWFIFFKKRAKK